ncbi:oxidoreductase [Flexivirga endophytica]|uniref:Oxidoreductase n=1 Tax=Flexivirga endophytica TaxID=1849103 RepID=A0A916SY86_9MICO|nr:SDR family NAD(P)-dependent oxidoreductase [Flexivirga endophytica]GGB23080.1 oxidoreductase [Flexivirga endophytica]GHB56983.1 oxidoreductase [Flexivirga endophytica]
MDTTSDSADSTTPRTADAEAAADGGPLAGQIVLIAGASRGLGRACAIEFAAAGAYVVCTGRSTRSAPTHHEPADLTLERTVDEVEAQGGHGEWHRCDHTDPVQVEDLVRDVVDRHGRIDILVNNAWGGHDHHDQPGGEEVWDEPLDQFRAMLLGGAYSDFVTSMLTLKLAMAPAGKGLILTSTWHTPEPPAWLPYESSKAAKNRLVYALGYHLQPKGIPAIAVAPGWMRTELMEAKVPAEELAGNTESPRYAARVMVALATDPKVQRFSGQVVDVGELAVAYGVTDLDGTQPQPNAGRFEPSRALPPHPEG